MIHYLFAGHFVHENEFIQFERVTDTKPAWYQPVIQKQLDQSIIDELLRVRGLSAFPTNWGMEKLDSGYIAWDTFCGVNDASEFIADLADRTGCDLADYSSLSFLTAEYLRKRGGVKG
jgi:hypothetical protein